MGSHEGGQEEVVGSLFSLEEGSLDIYLEHAKNLQLNIRKQDSHLNR